MHARSEHSRRSPPILALVTAALITAAHLTACGGARSVMAPSTPAVEAPGPVSLDHLHILLDPPTPAALAPFAVNPTLAVAAQPGIVFAPVTGRAEIERVSAALAAGRLPTDARPEGFVAALAGPSARGAPLVRAALHPSPYRPGYHGLRLDIAPPPAPPPPEMVVVLEARRGLLDDGRRAALRALIDALPPGPDGPRLGLLLAAERPRWIARAVPRAEADRWRAAVDGLELAGPSALPAALSAALVVGPVIAVTADRPPPLDGVAAVAPGDAADFAAALRRSLTAPMARGVRVRVEFDARAVRRYRLVGFDGDAAGVDATGTLWHGRPTAVLFEIERAPDAPPDRPLGAITISGRRPGIGVFERRAPIRAADDASGRVRAALLAAAVAERLRASWWIRGVDWPRLRADLAALPVTAGVGDDLGPIIERAAALDRRPDRFAEHGPADAMDPHAVPILRSPR